MYVIDYRVRTNKPMIISTNFSLADIEVRMPALVRLLGLMRREGNVSGKAVKRAIDAVRDGLVSAYDVRIGLVNTERMAQVAGR